MKRGLGIGSGLSACLVIGLVAMAADPPRQTGTNGATRTAATTRPAQSVATTRPPVTLPPTTTTTTTHAKPPARASARAPQLALLGTVTVTRDADGKITAAQIVGDNFSYGLVLDKSGEALVAESEGKQVVVIGTVTAITVTDVKPLPAPEKKVELPTTTGTVTNPEN